MQKKMQNSTQISFIKSLSLQGIPTVSGPGFSLSGYSVIVRVLPRVIKCMFQIQVFHPQFTKPKGKG